MCFVGEGFALVEGCVDESLVECVGYGLEDEQVAEAVDEVGGKPSRVMSGVEDVVNRGEKPGRIVVGHGFDRGIDKCAVCDPEDACGVGVGDAVVVGSGEELVEDGERVAGGSAAGADD